MRAAALAAACCAAILLAGCEGSATQTTNSQHLHGTLVDRDGEAVSGATIKAWPDGAIQSATGSARFPMAQATTDAEGRYALSELGAGRYNVFGEAGEGASSVLIPRVRYEGGDLDLGVDTLKPPGIVVGSVMAGGNPLEGVFCYAPGSSQVAMTDSLGEFLLDRVPEGSYALKYSSEGYVTAVDSPVVVRSGEITALPARNLELDISLQPPTLVGLEAEWDSVTGDVHVRWDATSISDLAGYELERTADGADADQLPGGYYMIDSLLDTNGFTDSLPQWYFGPYRGWRDQDTGTVSYRVRAIDKDGNRSRAYSRPRSVFLKKLDIQRTILSLSETGGVYDSALCRDTLTFAASFTNPVVSTGSVQFRVAGWFGGNKVHTKEVWYSRDYAKDVAADTLSWHFGMPVVLGMDFKPAGMDSLEWVSGANTTYPEDYGTPDSLLVTATVRLSGAGRYSGGEKRLIDIKVVDGCYVIRESRLPSQPWEY